MNGAAYGEPQCSTMDGWPIPTRAELVEHDSLDEAWVVEHFLGRSAASAYEMFATEGEIWTEALGWMAPKGLAFYLEPAIRYLESPQSEKDELFVSGLLTALSIQRTWRTPSNELQRKVRSIAAYVANHLPKFGISDDDMHVRRLLSELTGPSAP